jgi:hypothetical protein
MTSSLPQEIQDVFSKFVTTEFTTIDAAGQPITWPLTPYYRPGDPCSGLEDPPMVLVQGTADVDDSDLNANRKRYERELAAKLPATTEMTPPGFLKRFFNWYYTRIYVHVRPERIYFWPGCDVSREPQLWDAHMEEVRSGHDEEPESEQRRPAGGATAWDERMEELGRRHKSAVLSFVAPDGFPFSIRVPVIVDPQGRTIKLKAEPVGVPLVPGIACLTAHDHDDRFTYQRNFQVRGDLVEAGGAWMVVPHKLVGGFELPPGSFAERMRLNFTKTRRFHKVAKRELAKRAERNR